MEMDMALSISDRDRSWVRMVLLRTTLFHVTLSYPQGLISEYL